MKHNRYLSGFTIVELLIVVVVIAILAAVTIVAYSGIARQAAVASLQSDLRSANTKLNTLQVHNSTYPTPGLPVDVSASNGNVFEYTSDGATYCLTIKSVNDAIPAYYITHNGVINLGMCTGHGDGVIGAGSHIQQINGVNCPADRTRAVDARDGNTYWVQKMSNGKCWMLTNLAYAGGGTNTYGDVVDTSKLTQGTTTLTRTEAKYYISPGANVTSGTTDPSTSTDGTGQYGYHYNWCAAMGAQLGTDACSMSDTTDPSTAVSICPAGWRLPTGGAGSELIALNASANNGSSSTDAGLRQNWLAQRAGYLSGTTMQYQGVRGVYWASNVSSLSFARGMYFTATSMTISSFTGTTENTYSVRCLAN